mgnify:CR=1 FL=1
MRMKFMLCLLSILIITAVGCDQEVTREDFHQSYLIKSGTVIEINNPNGDVTIIGSDQEKVDIKAEKISLLGREALEQVEIFIDISDKMSIWVEHPNSNIRVSVNFEIVLPADLLVGLIECSNGDVTIDNVNGNPVIKTSNGTVGASGINGIVTASTSNGDIVVSGVRSIGDLRTSNGDIEAELSIIHENIELRSSNGSLSILVAPNLALDIVAETTNGTVSVNNLSLDIIESDRNRLVGVMNGGGARLSLGTSNGSITVSQLR